MQVEAAEYSLRSGVDNEGRSSMLHWKRKVTYLAVTALTILSAFVGDFDGWHW